MSDPFARIAAIVEEAPLSLGWKSSVAVRALDQLAACVVVTDGDDRVVDLNRAAGSLLESANGLAVRDGKLHAAQVFENAKLQEFIAAAAAEQSASGAVRQMVIGRRGGRLPLAVMVMQLGLVRSPLGLGADRRSGRAAGFGPGSRRTLRPIASGEPARGGARRRHEIGRDRP